MYSSRLDTKAVMGLVSLMESIELRHKKTDQL
jgi:hypothetical protein